MNSRICNVSWSQDIMRFLKRNGIPAIENMNFSDKKSTISLPRGKLHFSCCKSCGIFFYNGCKDHFIVYGKIYTSHQHFL
jgi:hypothetical protein